MVVDARAARGVVQLHAGALRHLVFWQQAHRQEQRVAGHTRFGAGDHLQGPGIHARHVHGGQAAFALEARDGGAQMQGNAEVVEALHDVAAQPGRMGHDLEHTHHLGALAHHAPRHDEADVARTQHDHTAAGQASLQVHEVLRASSRMHARRAAARHVERAEAPLARSGGQHHGARLHLVGALLAHGAHHMRAAVARMGVHVHDRRARQHRHRTGRGRGRSLAAFHGVAQDFAAGSCGISATKG